MKEVSCEVRAEIIIKLGNAINYENAANLTNELVDELVKQLVPDHPSLKK